MTKNLSFIYTAVVLVVFGFMMNWTKSYIPKHFSSATHLNVEDAEKEELESERAEAEEFWLHEFNLLKDPKTGTIPKGIQEKAMAQAMRTPKFDDTRDASSFTIESRGPGNMGGRTRAIAFDSRDANIMFAGGVSSGLFRSTNGGTSWTKVSPAGQIHNVTCIAQDPRAGQQDTWYYGTGELIGNSAYLGSFYFGHGIWKSTNNGLTWTALSSTQNTLENYDNVYDLCFNLAVNPSNGIVYAATANGVFASGNGGTNWGNLSPSLFSSATGSSDVLVTSTGVVYIAMDGATSTTLNGIWKSTDGVNFSRIASSGAPSGWDAQGSYGRIVLGTAPSNGNIVYALYATTLTNSCTGTVAPDREAKLWMWNNGTSAWTNKSANLPDESGCSNGNDPFAVQGGYDLAISVKPDNENVVFIGGTNIYRSTDAFTSNSNTTRIGGYASTSGYTLYTNGGAVHHSDIHKLTFAPGDNNTLYSGTDGGVYKANITGSVAWTALNNGYQTQQFYYIDIEQKNGSNAVGGGKQDNGTSISVNASEQAHTSILGGDGCAMRIISCTNANNFNIITSTQNGSLYRLNAPNNGWSIRPTGTSSSNFVTYFHLDEDNTNYLYYADGANLYRQTSASTIQDGTTNWTNMTGLALPSTISVMATSRNFAYTGANTKYLVSNANRKLYIGLNNGKLYRLNNPAFAAASATATDITPTGYTSGAVLSCISVNPLNDNEVLVTYANYGVPSVFYTANANSATPTWTNIEGNISLPSFRSCIITNSKTEGTYYWVGSSVGLFVTNTLNGASTVWQRVFTNELNYSVISSLRLRTLDNKLAIGTHGNGMFLATIPSPFPVQMSAFTGRQDKQAIVVQWETESETNNKVFELERSWDNENYEKITSINGKGNSTQTQSYLYRDPYPQAGVNYYRLKQIDFNGNFVYSNIIEVKLENVNLLAFPNPVQDIVHLQIPKEAEYVFLHDNQGRKVADIPTNATEWDMQNLPRGNYYLGGFDKKARPLGTLVIVKE